MSTAAQLVMGLVAGAVVAVAFLLSVRESASRLARSGRPRLHLLRPALAAAALSALAHLGPAAAAAGLAGFVSARNAWILRSLRHGR